MDFVNLDFNYEILLLVILNSFFVLIPTHIVCQFRQFYPLPDIDSSKNLSMSTSRLTYPTHFLLFPTKFHVSLIFSLLNMEKLYLVSNLSNNQGLVQLWRKSWMKVSINSELACTIVWPFCGFLKKKRKCTRYVHCHFFAQRAT